MGNREIANAYFLPWHGRRQTHRSTTSDEAGSGTGGPAVIGLTLRPVALRPCLSTGLPCFRTEYELR